MTTATSSHGRPGTLAPDTGWASPGAAPRPSFAIPLGLAVACHLAILWLAIAGASEIVGAESGLDDGITVEIVDAAALDRTPPQEQTAATSAPPAAAVPEMRANPAPPTPPANSSPAKPVPEVLSSALGQPLQVPARDKLDLNANLPSVGRAIAAAPPRKADPNYSAAEFYLNRRSGAAKAQAGAVDDFTRSIAAIVERNKPVAGMPGQIVLEFVISPNGRIENLRVTRSSGKPALDQMVIASLARASYIAPPETASLRDRTFEITINYR